MKKKAHHKQHIRLFSLWEKIHNANDFQFNNNSVKIAINWAVHRKYKGQ